MDFPTLTTLLGQFGAADPMMASPYGPLGPPRGSDAFYAGDPRNAALGGQGAPPPPSLPTTIDPSAPVAASLAGATPPPAASTGPTLYQRIMAGLFHTPSALQGVLSPEDQRAAQSQALLQMGARMMGAGLPPGSHSKFGMNLASALAGANPAYQQGIAGALQGHEAALGLQAQALNLGMRQKYLDVMQHMPPELQPQPGDSPQVLSEKYGKMSAMIAPWDPAASQGLAHASTAMASLTRANRLAAGGDPISPAEWQKIDDTIGPPPEPDADPDVKAAYDQNVAAALLRMGHNKTASAYSMQVPRLYAPQANARGNANVALRGVQAANASEKGFMTAPDVKPLLDVASRFPESVAILQAAANGDKAAYEQVGPQMAMLFDYKARMQMALLEKSGRLSTAMVDRLDTTIQRLQDGTYPPEQMQDALKLVQTVQNKLQSAIEEKRTGYLKGHPEARTRIRSTANLLGQPEPSSAPAGANPAAAAAAQLLGTP